MPSSTSRFRLPLAGGLVIALVALLAVGGLGWFGFQWWQDRNSTPMCQFRDGETTHQVTPEQAANAATIAMVGMTWAPAEGGATIAAQDRRESVTIALATAIQESKLLNLTYGDADSLGLFQQRPSQGWGSREDILDPVYAAATFYAALAQVDGWQQMELTVAAQTVQRSAFPEAYGDHEEEAQILSGALTGGVSAAIGCRLDDTSGAGSAQRVIDKATEQFGAPAQEAAPGVLIQAADAEQAWAIASWAVAHAEAEQIHAVSVAGYRWDRSSEPLGWEIVATDPEDYVVTIDLG